MMAFLLSSGLMNAGNGDDYITIQSGFLFPKTGNFQLGYEKGISYDASVELFGELGYKFKATSQHKEYYWGGGLVYKQAIKRYKNAELRLGGEIHAGAATKEFYFGAGLGLEYSYTFRSGVQFFIHQKNQVNFLKNDTFKNGLTLGIKVPL